MAEEEGRPVRSLLSLLFLRTSLPGTHSLLCFLSSLDERLSDGKRRLQHRATEARMRARRLLCKVRQSERERPRTVLSSLLHFFSSAIGRPLESRPGTQGDETSQPARYVHRKPDRFLIRLLCEFVLLVGTVLGSLATP